MEVKVKGINHEIRGVLEAFLTDVRYQKQFREMSNVVGCTSRKPEKYRASLFTVIGGEIGFVIGELNEMFADYQIETNLLAQDAIRDAVKDDPNMLAEYMKAAKLMMADSTQTVGDVIGE